jgi:hypothetical protein
MQIAVFFSLYAGSTWRGGGGCVGLTGRHDTYVSSIIEQKRFVNPLNFLSSTTSVQRAQIEEDKIILKIKKNRSPISGGFLLFRYGVRAIWI